MSIAWTAAEAVAATGGRLTGPADWQAVGVSIDSRSVKPGELFVALEGPSFDGHDYIAAALGARGGRRPRPSPAAGARRRCAAADWWRIRSPG